MPVTIFSKIKIRRGPEDELVDLDEAELGFTTDTGKLFIGAPDFPPLQNKGIGESNETFPFKNIQVITAISDNAGQQKYIFKGNGQTLVQTGPSLSQPVERTYQERFDDIVFFDNFITNRSFDISDDLNRALRQIYTDQGPTERRTIHLTAGNYIVNNPVKLPPYTHLKGAGIDRTFLTNTDAGSLSSHMFETVDKLFQENLQITTNNGGVPQHIILEDMTLTIAKAVDIIRLYRASNILFKNVKFKGAGAVSNQTAAVRFDRLGVILDMKNFKFQNCVFEDVPNVINALDDASFIVQDVSFDNCRFDMIHSGFVINHPQVKNFTVSNSKFTQVFGSLVKLSAGDNFSSINNDYDIKTLVPPNAPIIIDSGFNNFSSINDIFNLSSNIRAYLNKSRSSTIMSKNLETVTFKDHVISEKFVDAIEANKIDKNFGPVYPMNTYESIIIDYTVRTTGGLKFGSLCVSHDFTTPYLFDTYNETGNTDVSFSTIAATVDGELSILLLYTSGTSIGSINFTYRGFLT